MGEHDAPSVRVEVMVAGFIPLPEAYAFRPATNGLLGRFVALARSAGEAMRSPLLSYIVRHPSEGTILIDTGLHPDALRSLSEDYGRFLGGVFRGLRAAGPSFDKQLAARAVAPQEVRRVVMTHLHVDHTSGMRLLPRAEFLCMREEWEAATRPQGFLRGYARHHLPDRNRMLLLDLERAGEAFGPFSRTLDLLGDDSVRLVHTPGHTLGHCSVLLRADDGRQVLVVGDAAYTLRSIREQLLPAFTASDEASRRSLSEIHEFAERNPGAIVVPTHDPAAWTQLHPSQ